LTAAIATFAAIDAMTAPRDSSCWFCGMRGLLSGDVLGMTRAACAG
jgi:hypothetical protein